MTSRRIAQNNQQQKSETAQGSGILQRAAVRSVADAEMESTDDKQALALSNSAFSKDFSQVPISTTKPQQFQARNLQSYPVQPIQAKLTIGEPGDRYEQEADRVAAEVVRRINAPASAGRSVQRQEEAEEEIRAKPEITGLQRMKEPEEKLQAKLTLQRREAIAGGVESTINRARGGGQPLDAGLQQSMGQAMGADFSGVRVHTDTQSNQLNQSIQAKAFTTGQDVFFRQGKYQPGSRGGQELIAHELTHVVQQNGGTVQRSLFHYPQLSSASASNRGMGLVQRAPHPPGLADTENLYNAEEKSKKDEFTNTTRKPSFGANLYSAVIYTYQGGIGKTLTGQGTKGIKALTRATTQLDHQPSWNDRKDEIFDYAKKMTMRKDAKTLTPQDKNLMSHGYYIIKSKKCVPTVYGARMYYNDKQSLKPTAGGENASAGASSVQQGGAMGTISEEILKDYVLRTVGDYGLAFNEGLDIEDGGNHAWIEKNLKEFQKKLEILIEEIKNKYLPRAATSCQEDEPILNRLKNNLINPCLLTNILAIALSLRM
ncbi:eCIS core domain-containing protein [Nostoc sp. 'Peltigera malacea cyanobiont' DB3992]|uniref:eCIS core domain-containing protein n=1 Tax=Nostoc sp. 'Peltigera malacea cyanobiont' DB3992 TaxID=1206980 RepID=UPI00211E03C4|nr:DUF4157 domain-containing protein [Nostoc sp. 'Peltigera malacea cyanobiont' DB3992]